MTRLRDPADERVVRVSLTGAGRDMIEEAPDRVPPSILEATGLGREELTQLNQSLKKGRTRTGSAFLIVRPAATG